jgi:hypothetical protein
MDTNQLSACAWDSTALSARSRWASRSASSAVLPVPGRIGFGRFHVFAFVSHEEAVAGCYLQRSMLNRRIGTRRADLAQR